MQEWQREMERVHNVAEVIIAKQRHGPIGTVPLQFEGMLTKFSDLLRSDYIPTQTE
jgi:replicative DNA helicase